MFSERSWLLSALFLVGINMVTQGWPWHFGKVSGSQVVYDFRGSGEASQVTHPNSTENTLKIITYSWIISPNQENFSSASRAAITKYAHMYFIFSDSSILKILFKKLHMKIQIGKHWKICSAGPEFSHDWSWVVTEYYLKTFFLECFIYLFIYMGV